MLFDALWGYSIQALLKAGCDPNHVDNLGRTPSMYMRHGWSTKPWYVWLSILDEFQITDFVNLDDKTNEMPCPAPGLCSRCGNQEDLCCSLYQRWLVHLRGCSNCEGEPDWIDHEFMLEWSDAISEEKDCCEITRDSLSSSSSEEQRLSDSSRSDNSDEDMDDTASEAGESEASSDGGVLL